MRLTRAEETELQEARERAAQKMAEDKRRLAWRQLVASQALEMSRRDPTHLLPEPIPVPEHEAPRAPGPRRLV